MLHLANLAKKINISRPKNFEHFSPEQPNVIGLVTNLKIFHLRCVMRRDWLKTHTDTWKE